MTSGHPPPETILAGPADTPPEHLVATRLPSRSCNRVPCHKTLAWDKVSCDGAKGRRRTGERTVPRECPARRPQDRNYRPGLDCQLSLTVGPGRSVTVPRQLGACPPERRRHNNPTGGEFIGIPDPKRLYWRAFGSPRRRDRKIGPFGAICATLLSRTGVYRGRVSTELDGLLMKGAGGSFNAITVCYSVAGSSCPRADRVGRPLSLPTGSRRPSRTGGHRITALGCLRQGCWSTRPRNMARVPPPRRGRGPGRSQLVVATPTHRQHDLTRASGGHAWHR
jgi:hypothetical protein